MNADASAPGVSFADKGYDANFDREDVDMRGGGAIIPTKRNLLAQLPVDAAIYPLRHPLTATQASSTASQSDCGCANLLMHPSCLSHSARSTSALNYDTVSQPNVGRKINEPYGSLKQVNIADHLLGGQF